MPLVNKQPFKPNPIPDDLGPNDEVLYHELTNEVFTEHDAYFDRFLYCNSLIWTCSRTGKGGLTYKEALDSERAVGGASNGGNGSSGPTKKRKRTKKSAASDADEKESPKETKPPRKRGKSAASSDQKKSTPEGSNNDENQTNPNPDNDDDPTKSDQPVKKKKKKYPYDPKKYAMPVPEDFDPSLLTPTGKIDGRKLKSKRNMQLAEELLKASGYTPKPTSPNKSGPGTGKKGKAKSEESRKRDEEARKKEEEAKKKAQQAELAKERELEAKRKKEAAALARQLERQKKEEERKRAAAFLQNWEKKCEDLERDDLRRLPQPTPVNCEIPERLFGDAIYIMEAIYNFHDLYNFSEIYNEGLSYDTLEEALLDKHEGSALGPLLQFLLKVIFKTQPTQDGYGLDDDSTLLSQTNQANSVNKKEGNVDADEDTNEYELNGIENANSENNDDENDDENNEKYVNMNDRIGSAIRAARDVKKTFTKPLPEMDITPENVTEILRLHLLQSGSFPRGRTIYNGWYSSREDPGLWLCMEEPDLMKKLGEVKVYELSIEERIKILHTLINQLLTFIKTRAYMEMASEQLLELRKSYRKEAAEFARWDRENCVKRIQPPKRKTDQPANVNGHDDNPSGDGNNQEVKIEKYGNHDEYNPDHARLPGDDEDEDESNNNNQGGQRLKSCLKTNGPMDDRAEAILGAKSKKISFKNGMNEALQENGEVEGVVQDGETHNHEGGDEQTEQSFEEQERAYQQNKVDYEDYQRERAIRQEQLNAILLDIRTQLRNNQSVYAIHPVGRDRAYRRYWLFQSLPGLFVEQDDEFVGRCLPQPTPLESRYTKLFGKDNPLMHPNEADLIRPKTCDVACSTDSNEALALEKSVGESGNKETAVKPEPRSQVNNDEEEEEDENENDDEHKRNTNGENIKEEDNLSDKLNGEHEGKQNQDSECGVISDEMNYCTGDESTCYIHGPKRPTQRWWFYHTPESIDRLIESLNRRGYRECELHDVLAAESSIIKPRVAECPAYKLNRTILEQSGIRRSRRLRTKTGKRRSRKYE